MDVLNPETPNEAGTTNRAAGPARLLGSPQDRWYRLFLAAGVALAVLLRLSLFDFESNDYRYFMGPWYDHIAGHGGFAALKDGFSDYAPPYLYLLVAATYMPLKKLYAIKTVSVLFDFLLAAGVGLIVREKYRRSFAPVLAGLVTLFAPTVLANGALWGQTDAIFTSVLVLSLLSLIRGHTCLAMAAYGMALGFKAQAVFLILVFVVFWLKNRPRVAHLLAAPAAFLLSMVPAALAGRPLLDLLLVYPRQAGAYRHLTMGAPNLYQWLPDSYDAFRTAGILLAAAVFVLLCLLAVKSSGTLGRDDVVRLALVSALALPFFLPGMHERYFFPADVLSIVYAFYFPRYLLLPLAMGLTSLFAYLPFLMGNTVIGQPLLACVTLAVLAVAVGDWVRSLTLGSPGMSATGPQPADSPRSLSARPDLPATVAALRACAPATRRAGGT